MALLAPNIYILQYLKSTGQLTDAILKKADHFLTSGEDLDGDVCKKRGAERMTEALFLIT